MTYRVVLVLVICFLSSVRASGNASLLPPLTREALVGVWEASDKYGMGVWRMEIKKNGDSYLAAVGPGDFYRDVMQLVSCVMDDQGRVKLHFHTISANTALRDYWVDGKGVGDTSSGIIDATIDQNGPPLSPGPSGKPRNIYFRKGSWTRALAHLSRVAEESIKRKDPYPR